MEFDSPEAAKEFPGLYMSDSGKVDDSVEYGEDGEKKKSKKEKKKDKDKGYSALAAESSQDEDDPHDPKSPGKGMKIKAFSKLSGKKKEKDKKVEKAEKELTKKAEKEAKEKRKSEEKERKSLEKEQHSTPGPSAPRPQIPFSGAHLMRSSSQNQSASLTPQSSVDSGTPVKRVPANEAVKENTPTKPFKEKSAAFNVFLNAPAPLLSKLKDKDKDHSKEKNKKEHKDKEKKQKEKDKEKSKESKSTKKEKEHKEKEKKEKEHTPASGMAKVKLKLMRSKNSLEEPSSSDLPRATSHQFPEDPDALAKEIKKYEGLLEQAHLQLKSSKKISKKQEEQLWELQRTLTQLKRKLRSINALSCSSAYHIHMQSIDRVQPESSVSPVSRPIFKKCDSIDSQGMAKKLAANNTQLKSNEGSSIDNEEDTSKLPLNEKESTTTTTAVVHVPHVPVPVSTSSAATSTQTIPKIPMPPSKNSHSKSDSTTLTTSPPPAASISSASAAGIVPKQSSSSDVHVEPNPKVYSNHDEPVTPSAMSPVTSGISSLPDSNTFASPRPSIDTIVQVHRTSMDDDFSEDDNEAPQPAAPVAGDEPRTEEFKKIQSISQEFPDETNEDESIEAVLDDANKMIGSMHEELMFETSLDVLAADDTNRRRGDDELHSSNKQDDSSDVELFTNDLEVDPDANLPSEEPCPLDPFAMPIFETPEYLSIENEALLLFNEQLKDDIQREQAELEEALARIPSKTQNIEIESQQDNKTSPNEKDFNNIIAEWTKVKSENEALWDNVNRLRQAIAACKVDEFRLQTRLNYVESKNSPLSPATITTPLQTEA